jgi:hypothetical protein
MMTRSRRGGSEAARRSYRRFPCLVCYSASKVREHGGQFFLFLTPLIARDDIDVSKVTQPIDSTMRREAP